MASGMSRKIFGTGVIVLPLFFGIIGAISFNDWFGRWTGAICGVSIVLNVYLFIGGYYFFKSERFYLWVQRQLLRVTRTDTNWYFQVSYENILESDGKFAWDEKNFVKRLANSIEKLVGKQVCIEKELLNCFTLVVDNRIRLKSRYEIDGTGSLTVTKILVPSHRYDEYMNWLCGVFSIIEREFRAEQVCYRMHIEFPDRNPYFGFFVRHIPAKMLREFHCAFFSSLSEGATIDVNNDEIIIDADSPQKLYRLSKSYLSLSENLVTR